jgi:hypothetical protein
MRKLIVGTAVAGLLLAPSSVGAKGPNDQCFASNPGTSTCSFTVSESATTPVTGAVGRGTWVVIVKRGKVKTTLKSPSNGDPTATSYTFMAGDKVTAKALAPGSAVLTGGQ